MSDHTDAIVREIAVRELGLGDAYQRDDVLRFARAVAERVRERARVCGVCLGAGRYVAKNGRVNEECQRCACRGVTFGGAP